MLYGPQVWDILNRSYEKLGGFKSATDLETLINEPGYWKLVVRHGKITALGIYKKVHNTDNFKVIASATETEKGPDGVYRATKRGLTDYNMIKADDLLMKRSWAEVSGPAERLMTRQGALPISSRYAEFLIDKKIIDYSQDGYHYTRLIQGEPHEKAIMGFVKLSAESRDNIISAGISLEELPENVIFDK